MQQWPDKTRVPSPYRSPNEGRKKKKICGKMRFYLVQKWTFEKLNPGEDFQSAECRVDCFLFATWLKPVAQTGRRRVSDCMALLVQLAWDVRGNQSKQSNTWPPRPQWGDGESTGGGGGALLSRQEGGEARRGEAVTKLCRRKRRLWQNILKALLGDDWLIAPSPISCHRHRQQVHFIHLFDNIYTVLTLRRSAGVEQLDKTKRKHVIIWRACLVYSQRTRVGKRKWCHQRS